MKTGLESLDTGAPEITYEGNEGPKSPQQEQQMQMAQLQEEYEKHVFEMEEQGLQPMSMEQFMDQIMSEGQMSSNQEGIGSMMQDPRQMAAGGGIMRTGFQGGGASYGDSRRSGPAGGATMGGQGNVGGASNRDGPAPTYQTVHDTGAVSQTPGRPTYQNVHQTGAVSQTPGRTINTTPILDDRQIGNIDKRTVKINDRYRQNVRGEDYKLAKVPIEYEKYKNKKSLVPSYIKAIGPMA